MKSTPQINKIIDLLQNEYGIRPWQPHHDPVSELVQTILSQNTSDKNSRPAFRELTRTFPLWEDILKAKPEEIAEPIKSGGLAKIKALRIQQALQEIKNRLGKIELDILIDMPLSQAKIWLKTLPGVGDKTAACVLLFALGRPALPVDTHVFRVSKRLGLLAANSTLDKAHIILEELVAPELIYQFHVTIIDHGRKICLAQRPACSKCILKSVCPSNGLFTKGH
jgi:endonuclease-3